MGGEGLTPSPGCLALVVALAWLCTAQKSHQNPHQEVELQHSWDGEFVGSVVSMAVCLKILQNHFLEMKGSELWNAICEENSHRVPSPCQIILAKSEVDRDCMLLILVGERGQLSSLAVADTAG